MEEIHLSCFWQVLVIKVSVYHSYAYRPDQITASIDQKYDKIIVKSNKKQTKHPQRQHINILLTSTIVSWTKLLKLEVKNIKIIVNLYKVCIILLLGSQDSSIWLDWQENIQICSFFVYNVESFLRDGAEKEERDGEEGASKRNQV